MTKRNRLLDSFKVEGIPPAEVGREQIELTFTLDSDRILHVTGLILPQRTATPHLTVRRTGCLLGTKEIQRIQCQSETEKATDARESDEVDRITSLELLEVNLQKFFTSELKDKINAVAFNRCLPKAERLKLLAFVRSNLPGPDRVAPPREQIDYVFGDVKHRLCKYLDGWKGGIPEWLKPLHPKGYTPVPFVS
jgi:hypothetical protein